MRIKPRRTFSLLCPNGRKRLLARYKSSPDFVAAIARMKPPRKRMIIGSAKVAIISFDFNRVPRFPAASSLKNEKLWFDVVSSINVIMASDVAHAGTASVSHIKVANTKIAMTLCCTMVSPSMPNVCAGRFQTTIVMNTAMRNSTSLLTRKFPVN